jgi:hypothetical protein
LFYFVILAKQKSKFMKQKNFLKIALLGLLFLFSKNLSIAQTSLYLDNFTNEDNKGTIGATTDLTGVDWSVNTSSGAFTATSDYFAVQSGQFEAKDVDGDVIFTSETFSVSGYTNLQFIFDAGANGDFEASGDLFEIRVYIDGTPQLVFEGTVDEDAPGDPMFFGSTQLSSTLQNFSANILSTGTNAYVEITANNNTGTEEYFFDNLEVQGTVASSDTSVAFKTATSTVSEDGTSIDICVGITNPDINVATTVDVILDGSSTALNPEDYSPSLSSATTLTFPANSSTDQCITINLADDGITESNELLIVNLQNVSGGNNASLGLITQHALTITDDDLPNIIINEILFDPNGDANGDGNFSTTQDEFIEIYNTSSSSLDISNFYIQDAASGGTTRHIFPSGTILPANQSIVVFGGGSLILNIPGLSQLASTGALGLNNGEDTITIYNDSDVSIVSQFYDSGGNNQSIARNPDFTGTFEDHSGITGNSVEFSPGKSNTDNSSFTPTVTWDGSESSSWSVPGNWNTNSVPTLSDDIVIPSVSPYPTIGSSINAVGINLSISNGATLDIESGGTLTLSGNANYSRTLTGSRWYFMSSPVIEAKYDDNFVTRSSIDSGQNNNRGISTYNNNTFDTDEDGTGSDTETGNWRYFQDGGTATTFNKGQGYGIILSNSGTVSFTGKGIYTTDQTYLLEQGINNFNLIGNPFTGFITLGTFHTTNSGVIGTSFYTWNGSSYTTRLSNVTNSDNQNYEIAPGQGFFVEATTASNVTFEVSDVSNQNTDTFEKTSNEIGEIKLNLTEGKNNRFARIYYINDTTTGFDNGYDGKLFSGVSNPFAIYSHLVSESKGDHYQIQSLPNSNYENMVISIGVNATANKEITFSADALNLPGDIKVFLEDRQENKLTRLDEANSEYTITLNEKLDGIGRFYLHTKSSALSINELNLDNISIYKTNNSNLRIVGLSEGKANVKLFNILGKQVLDNSFSSNGIKDINLPNLASGIYVVQLETETGKLNKKITLE